MPDIDFSSYLAARREKQQTPVTVNLAGRDVQFRALFSAEPLITAAVNGEIETDTEQLVIRKLPFEEAFRMVEAGAITDSISVAAILRVQLMLLSGGIK